MKYREKDWMKELGGEIGKMITEKLFNGNRAVFVAADVESLEDLKQLVQSTCDVKGIGGYKVGLVLALRYGLNQVVETIQERTSLPVIYDHQKGGTDIPELGVKFAKVVAESGAKGAILFPFGGAVTMENWIESCQHENLTVLVGGHMTQKKFLASEGGFIADNAPAQIYSTAAKMGVQNFVVPGNKVEFVRDYRDLLEWRLGEGNFVLWAPGFIAQEGVITEFALEAGSNWATIVGSAIYKAKDKRKAAETITANL